MTTDSPAAFAARGAPLHPDVHRISAADEYWVLSVETGQLRELGAFQAQALDLALGAGDAERVSLMTRSVGFGTAVPPSEPIPTSVRPRALSLAIAQTCNLGCTYCYAEQGTFGGDARHMSTSVARASVDRLIAEARPGEHVTLAFMGGEPLLNRAVLHDATRYAKAEGERAGVSVGYAVTTNATAIRDEDVQLFGELGFTVTVSLDGDKAVNDLQRPLRNGGSSFALVEAGLRRLMIPGRRHRVLSRVTITPRNLDVRGTLEALSDFGFDSIRVSPMLSAPSAGDEMQAEHLQQLLESMIACGELFHDRLQEGAVLPLENITGMLRRIHVYRREEYPCGAGGGYLGVSATGGLYACHRFVNDESGRMGAVESGVDDTRQAAWLAQRNLRAQAPCGSCWARYLCSGSCHHEVIHRGRPACDYIRGWLDYCLELYIRLRKQPALLERVLRADAVHP